MDRERPRALVIEDAPEVAALTMKLLSDDGFEVYAGSTGQQGLALARERAPDVILLDLSLPDIDGFEVCRALRKFSDAYVIMVTNRDDEVDRVVGLTVGADDYVAKPFSPRELIARIHAMRRRPRTPGALNTRDFGRLVLDPDARDVTLDGKTLGLTKIEFELLELLTSQPRRAFTRAQLLDQVWGEWYSGDHMIDVHIGNLRRKLGDTARKKRYVHTVRGVGFRFEP
ncbi:MAG: response regulator transcription factor [Candidatus Nanopelagicales bacterium]